MDLMGGMRVSARQCEILLSKLVKYKAGDAGFDLKGAELSLAVSKAQKRVAGAKPHMQPSCTLSAW